MAKQSTKARGLVVRPGLRLRTTSPVGLGVEEVDQLDTTQQLANT